MSKSTEKVTLDNILNKAFQFRDQVYKVATYLVTRGYGDNILHYPIGYMQDLYEFMVDQNEIDRAIYSSDIYEAAGSILDEKSGRKFLSRIRKVLTDR